MDDLSLSEDDRSSRDSEKEVESDDDENRSRTGDRESDEGHTKSDDDSEQPPGSDEGTGSMRMSTSRISDCAGITLQEL